MKRDYATGEAQGIDYFTGVEIEHTPAYNLKTLFVVGVKAPEEITAIATQHECDHVYFGANQSFDGKNIDGWVRQIEHVLRLGFRATLDFDVDFARHGGDCVKWFKQLNTFDGFIPMISVKIPDLTMYNNNATLKIDDRDFDATNPGVWCHSLTELTTNDQTLTEWAEYSNDQIIEEDTNAK